MSDPIIEMTTEIVASYVAGNSIEASDLPALIRSVFNALNNAEAPTAEAEPESPKPTAAQIKKSITPDALISFIDGKRYKTLKRHLTTHGLTVADYKARYGLPADYPTTAPSYSEHRSAMARTMGLGSKGRAAKGRG
jgi:predicted transcriptional regulator